jgi:hypothetical protein
MDVPTLQRLITLIASMLVDGLCQTALFSAQSHETKPLPEPLPPPSALATSDVSADTAAVYGAEVLRAVAASEPAITERSAAHLSTRSGEIEGGGMVHYASCKQRFTVVQVLAGPGDAREREINYSFLERAEGFLLPRPTRPVAEGEKVVLVLGAGGKLVKFIKDTNENSKEIEAVAEYVKTRPPAARVLLDRMSSFTLKLEYHGSKGASHPSIWYTTNAEAPDGVSPKWVLVQNPSEVWAHRALDHLVRAGVLKPETIDRERKLPRPGEPHYSLILSADGVDELTFVLGWGKEAHARIEALARAIHYGQQALTKVLAGLKEEDGNK